MNENTKSHTKIFYTNHKEELYMVVPQKKTFIQQNFIMNK
jgi:hypothetical protein